MNYLYSANTNGFYVVDYDNDKNPYGDDLPADCVEISEAEYNTLFEGQANGKIIGPDNNGYPILSDPPEDTRTDDELADEALANAEESPVMVAMYQTLEELSNDKDFESNFKNKVKDKIKKDKKDKKDKEEKAQ